MSSAYNIQYYDNYGARLCVPPASYLIRAGATGAMVAGGWAAYSDLSRVKKQEISREEAVSRTLTGAAVGAGAGVLVGTAAHLARCHPMVGLAAVLAAGAGALYLAGSGTKQMVADSPAQGGDGDV